MVAASSARGTRGVTPNFYFLLVLCFAAVVGLIKTRIKSFTHELGSTQEVIHQSLQEKEPAGIKTEAVIDTSKNLIEMGLTPIYNPSVTDPWKVELFQRLDRIRVVCGDLCKLNTIEEITKHSVPVPLQHLPMVVVPDVNCHGILGFEEIDASDSTAPAIPEELVGYFTLNNAYSIAAHELLNEIFLGGESDTRYWATGNIWNEDDVEALVKSVGEGTAKGSYGVGETNTVRDKQSGHEGQAYFGHWKLTSLGGSHLFVPRSGESHYA